MNDTPWRTLLDQTIRDSAPSPHSRFVQLGTLRLDGRPAVRTVVFRGFLEGSDRLRFTTDSRSAKAGQLAACDWAEACWYFADTRQQFRLAGTALVVDGENADPLLRQARLATWQTLSDESRLTFSWPAPGTLRNRTAAFPSTHPNPTEPLPHFSLLVLDPQEVEHLKIQGDPQDRWIYRRDDHGRWSTHDVNP